MTPADAEKARASLEARVQAELRRRGINANVQVSVVDERQLLRTYGPQFGLTPVDCPVCKDVMLVPKGVIPQGVCPHCTSFVALDATAGPITARAMTTDDVLALSDEERIRLQRCRRQAEEQLGEEAERRGRR